jgi:hypothetical protein
MHTRDLTSVKLSPDQLLLRIAQYKIIGWRYGQTTHHCRGARAEQQKSDGAEAKIRGHADRLTPLRASSE